MATMETLTSQYVPEEVGGSSGGAPSINSSATKHKKPPTVGNQKRRSAAKQAKSPTLGNQQKSPTSCTLKRPAETSQKKQPAAKIVKSPTMGNQQKSPTSSPLKRPAEMSKQRQPPAKQFKPPMAGKKQMSSLVRRSPLVTGAPMMRLVLSPVVMGRRSPSHSPRSCALLSHVVERSPSPSTSPLPCLDDQTRSTDNPDSSSAKSKPRRLRSEILNDMDPIYHDGKVIQARCKHCNEVHLT